MKPKFSSWLNSARFGVFSVTLALTLAAPAAVQIYDSANPAAVWDTTTANWDGSTVTWTNGNDALFDAGTGTVTVVGTISLGELVVSSTTESTIGGIGNSVYRFNGGALSFGSSLGMIDTAGTGARNSQINSNLVGTAGLEIFASGGDSGQGRIILGGDNSGLTGGITVKTGLLVATSQSATGANVITLDGGGLFGAANHSGTAAAVVTGSDQHLANNIVLQNSTSRIRVWGGRNLLLTGTISGEGGLRKVDTGNLVLLGTQAFTGEVNVFSGGVLTRDLDTLGTGTINVGGSGQPTLGYFGTSQSTARQVRFSTASGGIITAHGNLTLTSGLTGVESPMGVILNGGGSGSITGVSTGALVNFNKQGVGTWTVNGALNLVGGQIRPQGGVIAFSATSSTAADAAIAGRANGGVIRFASGSSILTETANTDDILGAWATFDNTTWAKTNGSGNAIDGFSAFNADTWVAGTHTNVTLAGGDPATDSTTSSLRFNEAGAKTLTLAGTNTLTSGGLMVTANVGANNTTITGGTLVGANTLDLVIHQFNTGGSLTIGSIISNNTGATGITKTGAGTVVLSGANNYTGTTRVFEGILRVTGNNGAKFYEVGSQGRLELDIDGGTSGYGRGILVNGAGISSTNGVYLAGGRNFNLQSTLRLAGAPTTVRQFGTGAAILHGWDTNGTHLAVENTASGSVIAANVNFQSGGFGYVMNIAPGLNTAAGDLIINGIFSGSTVYRKTGFGSVRLDGSGSSNNTGTFALQQGNLILAGSNNRLGSGSNVILGNGPNSGLLILEGVDQTLTALTNAGTGTENRVVAGSATLSTLTINNAADTTIAAAMGGPGVHQNNLALTKTGVGALTLSGSNSFTGDTTSTAGTLVLDYSIHDTSKLSDSGMLTLGGNLILNGGSHEEIVAATVITGPTSITRTSSTAVINLGALSRTGSGSLNLGSANLARTSTPNGPSGSLPSWVTIDGSPAAVDANGNIIAFVPTFSDVVRLGGKIPNNATANVRIIDGGTTGPVTPNSSGLTEILTLTQAATAGPATINLGAGDTLRLGEIGTIAAAPGAASLTIQGGSLTAGGVVDAPGTLAITGEAVVTIASALENNGEGPLSIAKSGPGSLTLSETNNHTGGLTLNGGNLLLGHQYALGLSGPLTFNGGAFDNVTGGDLVINDAFTQVWNGNFSYLGSDDLTFQNGSLNITGNRQVTVGASLLEMRLPVSGAAGFTKLGEGTLLLSGTGNNWTGTTTVSDGELEVLFRNADGGYVVDQGATLRLGYITGGGYAATNMKLHGDGVAATTGLYLRGGASYNASGTIELLTAPTTIRHYGTGLAAIGMFDINGNGMNVSAAASGSVIDENIQLVSRGFGMSMTVAQGSANATGDLVVNGPLNVGSLGFYKRGPGSVRLNGTATTGNTAVQIQGGRVIAGAANVLGANANLPISGGASLDLNGFDQEAASLSGAGSVFNGSAIFATLAVKQTTDATFSGVLGGATPEEDNFAFVKNGPAALTLSANNFYTGDTTVSEGTLTLAQPFLSDSAAVRITAGATLALPHGEADTVNALFINGIQQPANTYTSSNSAFITGDGSLVVSTGPSADPFATWAAANGLDGSPGKAAGFNDDPDGDGVENGLEWILGGNPLDGKSGSLVTVAATAGGGLTLTFTRNDASLGQSTLTVEHSATLAAPWASVPIGATSSGPDANGVTVTINAAPSPDQVTVNIPASNAIGGKLFGRLKATQP